MSLNALEDKTIRPYRKFSSHSLSTHLPIKYAQASQVQVAYLTGRLLYITGRLVGDMDMLPLFECPISVS